MANRPNDEWLHQREAAEPETPQEAKQRAIEAYCDDRYAERLCDFCQRLYRGPAVYCQLSCAQADA